MSNAKKLEEAYAAFHKICYYQALSILKDPSLAEDAVQETFLILSKNLDKIDSGSSRQTGNYLITILKNLCFYWQNKRRCEVEWEDVDPASSLSTEDTVVQRLSVEALKEAIEQLNPIYRQALSLKYYCGFSNLEISKLLHISENLVSVRIFRGKNSLKKRFLNQGGDQ